MFVVEILRLPHLVLAHVGRHNCIAACDAPQVVHHVSSIKMAGVGKILDVTHCNRALAGINGLEPRRAVTARDPRQQLLEHFTQIAHQGNIDLHVLVDFSGIDFDVNLFGLEGIGCDRSCDAVVEAHAASDEEVSFLYGVVNPRLAMHAHHAHVERMRRGKRAQAEQCEGHRNLRALCQGADLLHGAGLRNAVSRKNDRALGVADQLRGLCEAAVFHTQHGVRPIWLWLGGFEVEDRGGLLGVLGNVDQHGTGATGLGNLEG